MIAVKSQVLVWSPASRPAREDEALGQMAQQAKAAGQDAEHYVRERSQEFPLVASRCRKKLPTPCFLTRGAYP
jgi:hypothetical protein